MGEGGGVHTVSEHFRSAAGASLRRGPGGIPPRNWEILKVIFPILVAFQVILRVIKITNFLAKMKLK